MADWQAVIGLEIHAQLNTRSKIFSAVSTAFGADPNTQASLVDLGFPGVLPVTNEAVYEKAVAFGLGVGATINHQSVFDRKNYFYPDLPKGYQITQLDEPIVEHGHMDINCADGGRKTIHITRAHLEEDAGKSLHKDYAGETGIDLNRAGTPLLEIVSEPDLRSAEEASTYARQIHKLLTYLDICDGNMAEGSMRCDANVSIRPTGSSELGTRTETKNINSFRFLEQAINHEIERQIAVIESGGRVVQETRLYDPDRDETRPMRSKETAMDYRYFPEPDLLPVVIDDSFISAVRDRLPEMPYEKRARFQTAFGLSEEDAETLSGNRSLADYFEYVASASDPRQASNWVRVELLGRTSKDSFNSEDVPVPASELASLINRISDETISGKIAKTVFDALWQGEPDSVDAYIDAKGLKQVSDSSDLAPIVTAIIANNTKQVEQYRAGKTKLLGFFVGQVMKETGGKANPKQVNDLVRIQLDTV